MGIELTESQRKVLELLEQGLTAIQVAEELGITRNAVNQTIARLRKYGVLPSNWTPSGRNPQQFQPGAHLLNSLLESTSDSEGQAASVLALVEEIRRTRDQLDSITQRLSNIVPR